MAATLLVPLIAVPASAAGSDPHAAETPAMPVDAFTTSVGIAPGPWADPVCSPPRGTGYKGAWLAPASWADFLLQSAGVSSLRDAVSTALQTDIATGWDAYVASVGSNPDGFSSESEAASTITGLVTSDLLSQTWWDSLIQKLGNIPAPATANPEQFLAFMPDYGGTVGGVCDGLDGSNLFLANSGNSMFQLGNDGTWSLVTFQGGAPPAKASWIPVPGVAGAYVATEPASNSLDAGAGLVNLVGEMFVSSGVPGDCGNMSGPASVRQAVADAVYAEVQKAASWMPMIPALPEIATQCAYAPAVYVPWTNGPEVLGGGVQFSNSAIYAVSWASSPEGAVVARWRRDGTTWGPAQPFASAIPLGIGLPATPRIAISGDGQTVVGCDMGTPLSGSGFSVQDAISAGFLPRWPMAYHFYDGQVSWPQNGTTDFTGCVDVTTNDTGDTVWWNQSETAPGWWVSSTLLPGESPSSGVIATTPQITWPNPEPLVYGQPLTSSQLDATATDPGTGELLNGTWSYSPPTGTILQGGTQTLSVTFTPADTTDYMTATAHQTITVNPAPQVIAFPPIPDHTYLDPPVALTATGGGSGNPVTFSATADSSCAVVGGQLALTGAGSCTIIASQNGNADYLPAPDVTNTFLIAKATRPITLPPIPTQQLGDPPVDVTFAGDGASTPVTLTAAPPTVCTLTGTTITIVNVGTCTVTANQNADANYNPAPAVSQTFAITYVVQSLTNLTQAAKSGSVIPIRVQLQDGTGSNVSNPSIVLHATSVDGNPATAPGASQSGGDFRFLMDPASYAFNLDTSGLASGVHQLSFTAGADPMLHTITFEVK